MPQAEPLPRRAAVDALVAADQRRFERIAARLRLGLGGLGVVALLGNAESNSASSVLFSAAAVAVAFAWAIFAWSRTRAEAAPEWTKWVSAAVDVTFVTAFSAGGLYNYSGAYETLLAPLLVGLYPLFLLLTALTGSAPATLFAGLLAAAERLALLTYIVDHGLVRTSEAAMYGNSVVAMPDQYTIVAFLAVLGGFFAGLAALLRREWAHGADETERKREAERLQAHYRKYLSAAVADFVTSNPAAMGLGGARRTASVLFLDIRDFTPFAEAERPERVVEFLNGVFSEFVAVVFANGGTLDKFLGDGLMAVFGVPQPMDDAPVHAVRAAVELQACARRLNAARPAGQPELRIGVGIAHGVVVAGNVGSPDRMEFTVIGDTVNFAARLQALCKDLAHDIVVSDTVREGAGPGFHFRRMPPVRVKGKAGTPVIWAVVPTVAEAAAQ
jgi:adenylate cyclase